MSPEVITILMIVSLFILLAGFPLAFGIGTVGLVFGYLVMGEGFFQMIPIRIVPGILSEHIFAAIPLFIFMGTLMQTSGVAERAFEVFHRWMSGVKGGLAIATICLSVVFAATTGVVGASETAIGLLAIPAMLSARYSPALASGCVCAGGTLGILIPPSIMLILYAPMAGVSVIQMFAGAIVPGLMLATAYILYILIRCFLNPSLAPDLPSEEHLAFFSLESLELIAKHLFPPFLLILLVLGSIFFGVASPTEASAVGSVGAIILCLFYRKLTWENFKTNCYTTMRVSAMIMFIAIAASIFTGAFLAAGCGTVITDMMTSFGLGRWGIFITMMLLILFMGMFIDWIGILLIIMPIFIPILKTLGFDMLWVGLVICTSLQISFLSPPFAYSIFYLKGLDLGLQLPDIYRGVIPFVGVQIIVVILLILFPELVLWLPKVMVK